MEGLVQYNFEVIETDTPTESTRETSTGGEDTTNISLWVQWSESAISNLILKLESLKRRAQNRNKTDFEDTLNIADKEFIVKPYGLSPDKNASEYCFFQWIMSAGGVTYMISNRNHEKNTPNVYIEVGSVPLIWADGLSNIWKDIQDDIRKMGGIIIKNSLGRVDPCADLKDFDIDLITDAFRKGNFINRCACKKEYFVHVGDFDRETYGYEFRKHSVNTGFCFGKKPIHMRVYEKAFELKGKGEYEKIEAMNLCRYGTDELPEQAIRVEFELRRDALRGFRGKHLPKEGIVTVEDWLKHRGSIMSYLLNKWVRFVVKKHKGHTERCETAGYWQKVIDAFENWTGKPSCQVNRAGKTLKAHIGDLVKQSIGCVQSAFAKGNVAIYSIGDFIHKAVFAFKEFVDHDEFFPKYGQKLNRVAESVPDDMQERFSSRELMERCGGCVTHSSPKVRNNFIGHKDPSTKAAPLPAASPLLC